VLARAAEMQRCQVVITKKGQISLSKNSDSTEKSQIAYTINTPRHLQNTQIKCTFERHDYVHIFIHKQNKAHSINELLETFGFVEE